MNVLAIDVEKSTISLLQSRGLEVYTGIIISTQDLENWLGSGIYDACIVFLRKGGFGFAVARTLRSRGINTPLIGVVKNFAERSWGEYRASFLEQGGDDLLNEPNSRELVASLQAITRRMNLNIDEKLEYQFEGAHLIVDNLSYQATINETPLSLTRREMEILQLFTKTPDRVFSKETIIARMYNDFSPESNVIASLVSRLRIKMSSVHPDAVKFIKPIRGKGYIFQSQNNIH